jgi:hypothetical protein
MVYRGDLLCNSIIVKDTDSVVRLKEGGYGARELLSVESSPDQAERSGPLLLLDEEVKS